MGKEHIITYGESVRVSCDDYRFVRTSKVVNENTTVCDMLEWLKSLGVKEPNLTMLEFSILDGKDT
jgi:hypothetical protein